MTTQTDSLVVKLDADVKKFEQKILAAESSVDKLGVTTGKATNKVGGMGRGAGQAGIQMQQFIGQIQGGQSAMLALSQQSADLGFVLGAPLIGAVVGISASIAGMLMVALRDGAEQVKDFTFDIDEMAKSLDKINSLTTNQLKAGLIATNKQLTQIEKQSKETGDKIFVLSEKLNEGAKTVVTYSKTGEAIISSQKLTAKETKKLNEELIQEKANLDALNKTKADQLKIQNEINAKLQGRPSTKNKIDAENEATKESIKLLREKQKASNMLFLSLQGQTEADPMLANSELLNEQRLRDEQRFIDDINEIKFTGLETDEELFFKQQEIHQAMLDNKLISEKEFAAAQARIAKEFAGELKVEEKVVKQTEAQKLNTRQTSIRAAMAINGAFLDDNKEIAAGLIVADTYTGMQKALAIDPIGGWANALAIGVTGAANLAGALSSGRGGGGGISGSSGGAPAPQQNFERETSSLEVSDSTSSGSGTQMIGIPDGDEIGEAIFNWIKKAEAEGRD